MANVYKSLTDFIPYLTDIEFGTWEPKVQSGDGSLEKPLQMPYMVFDEVVKNFIREVYRFEENHPEYGLHQYGEILKQNGLDWGMDSMAKAEASQLDGKCIMALILGAIRADRFSEGALKAFYDRGCILKWLNRLKELDEQAG